MGTTLEAWIDTAHGTACATLLCASVLAAALAGCSSSAPTRHGEVKGAQFTADELLQSDGNRLAQAAMRANLNSLRRLADKLYRRNPAEWRKTAATRAQALHLLDASVQAGQPWAPLQGQRDVAALSLALSPSFTGDRVAAFIAACADTIVAAHGGKREFYYLDGVEPQHIYNAARNMEIALWILNTRRGADGHPLLYANEITGEVRNLSFEREFGQIIGRLDLLAAFATERYRRAAIDYVQGLVAAPFLAFLPVK